MPSNTTTDRALPTPEELALVAEQLGTFMSALDEVRSTLTAATWWPTLTVAEYERRRDAGVPAAEWAVDADRLAHLIAFAVDVSRDAEWIAAEALQLRDDALSTYRETTGTLTPAFVDARIAETRERLAELERMRAEA